MNTNDILKLVNAGFTAEQIRAMDDQEVTHPAPVVEPVPVLEPEPAPAPAPAAQPEVPEYISGLKSAIDQLTATVQAGLIRGAGVSAPSVEDVPDILAKVINPYSKKEV